MASAVLRGVAELPVDGRMAAGQWRRRDSRKRGA